jgi:hypothetical protein
VVGEFTGEAQHHDLARARIGTDPDLGVQPRLRSIAIARQHRDHTAGMLAAGEVGRFDGVLEDLLGVGSDDQRQHSPHRDRAAFFPKADDLLVDVVGSGLRQIDDHGRLQSLPMRRIISNAESGPQVPDSYGSGLPSSAQWSSTGSSISQEYSTSRLTGKSEGSPSSMSRINRS